jgi:hypothetical protein
LLLRYFAGALSSRELMCTTHSLLCSSSLPLRFAGSPPSTFSSKASALEAFSLGELPDTTAPDMAVTARSCCFQKKKNDVQRFLGFKQHKQSQFASHPQKSSRNDTETEDGHQIRREYEKKRGTHRRGTWQRGNERGERQRETNTSQEQHNAKQHQTRRLFLKTALYASLSSSLNIVTRFCASPAPGVSP